jgi:ureidoglycolate hydrolase
MAHPIADLNVRRLLVSSKRSLAAQGSESCTTTRSTAMSSLKSYCPIRRLPPRGLVVRQITPHRNVTQCRAAMGGKSWLLAVGPPKGLDDPAAEPALGDIAAFAVPGTVALKLHRGTWHAGPYFEYEEISFLNLELSDTNENDHQSCRLVQRFGFALRCVSLIEETMDASRPVEGATRAGQAAWCRHHASLG